MSFVFSFERVEQESGQQWDGRNAWPPLQWMLAQGLRQCADALATRTPSTPRNNSAAAAAASTTSTTTAKVVDSSAPAGTDITTTAAAANNLALEIEEAFLNGALAGWEATGGMMEKYDAENTGKGGGGGEYNLQVRFRGSSLGAAIFVFVFFACCHFCEGIVQGCFDVGHGCLFSSCFCQVERRMGNK